MKNWLLKKILSFIAKKFDGKKTIIGGIGLIMLGIAGVISNLYPELDLPMKADIEIYFTYIASGFSVLGLGGKLQKILGGKDVGEN